MQSAQYDRRQAAEARERGERATAREIRIQYLDIASQCEDLAKVVETEARMRQPTSN